MLIVNPCQFLQNGTPVYSVETPLEQWPSTSLPLGPSLAYSKAICNPTVGIYGHAIACKIISSAQL